jgi:NAD(P)H-dependent flavin oxidoreductase YrpB (nitropropane dioxygenase family)
MSFVHPLYLLSLQWVGLPKLASAVSNAGGLGIITALTQPSPADLEKAVASAQKMLRPEIAKRSKYGALGVNITLLPSITPPDYPGYANAALKAGIRIFETAGNNREYDVLRIYSQYYYHSLTQTLLCSRPHHQVAQGTWSVRHSQVHYC